MLRIEHEEWACPICGGQGHCDECASLHTREDYYHVQELAEAAMRDENGTAARVLDHIAWWPSDLPNRDWWVARMIQGARRQLRMEN